MCRNIKPLYNLEPPVTDDEIQLAALQFLRKITGFAKPSKANEAAFHGAVADIATITRNVLGELETTAAPRSREELAERAIQRSVARFGERQAN